MIPLTKRGNATGQTSLLQAVCWVYVACAPQTNIEQIDDKLQDLEVSARE